LFVTLGTKAIYETTMSEQIAAKTLDTTTFTAQLKETATSEVVSPEEISAVLPLFVDITAWFRGRAWRDAKLRRQEQSTFNLPTDARNLLMYHYIDHFYFVGIAGKQYIEALEATPASDPLKLNVSLEAWNRLHHTEFTLQQLSSILQLFAMAHDSGNFLSDVRVNEIDGTHILQTKRYPKVNEVGAEQRSSLYLETVYGFKIPPEIFQNKASSAILELVQHLISLSEFRPGKLNMYEETGEMVPFLLFIQSIDQLGGNVFGSRQHYGISQSHWFAQLPERLQGSIERWPWDAIGLMIEKIDSAEYISTGDLGNPHYFLNFVRLRLDELFEDQTEKEQLLKIWDVHVPELVTNLMGTPIPNQRMSLRTFVEKVVEDYRRSLELHQVGIAKALTGSAPPTPSPEQRSV
jgi:hypothetical protein